MYHSYPKVLSEKWTLKICSTGSTYIYHFFYNVVAVLLVLEQGRGTICGRRRRRAGSESQRHLAGTPGIVNQYPASNWGSALSLHLLYWTSTWLSGSPVGNRASSCWLHPIAKFTLFENCQFTLQNILKQSWNVFNNFLLAPKTNSLHLGYSPWA